MAKKDKMKPLYPDGLLTKSREERFEFYKHEQFMHREFESVHAQVICAIRNPGHKRVIALLGPSGVGKSEVKRYLQETVAEMVRAENSKDRGRLPYISYYVPAYRGKFDWKDESETFLLAGHEPAVFLDHRIDETEFDFAGNIIRCNNDGEPLVIRDLALRKLMRARQSCLKHRRPKVVFADEAHHYKKVGVGRKQLLDQVDIIKLILDLSEIVHVFIGTYELFDLIDVSEQIAGRTRYIHFPRYRLSSEKDIISFKAALRGAQQKLPLPGVLDEADWAKEYKYFYYGCVGCIGTLKEWILRALDLALEAEENSRLSGEADPKSDCPSHPFRYYLDETRDTPGQLGQMNDAACDGEATWAKISDPSDLLRKLELRLEDIGITSPDMPDHDSNTDASGISVVESSPTMARMQEYETKIKKKRIPGRRNPHSDSTIAIGA